MLLNMRHLLAVARANRFAVPAFNSQQQYVAFRRRLRRRIEANAPVIIAIHPYELAFVGTAFEKFALAEAIDTSVPVVIHLDDGSSLEQIMVAIRAGFTSVMIDASELPLEGNIEACREVVELAHKVNVSVEGELGTIGELDEEAEAGAEEVIFANPDEVKSFVDATGVDTLASRHWHLARLVSQAHETGNSFGSSTRNPARKLTSRWCYMGVPAIQTRKSPKRSNWVSTRSIFPQI